MLVDNTMIPDNNTDDTLLIYADFLNDNYQHAAEEELRLAIACSSTNQWCYEYRVGSVGASVSIGVGGGVSVGGGGWSVGVGASVVGASVVGSGIVGGIGGRVVG